MILVVDLEATCADDGSISPEDMEIIEIGAVLVTDDGDATRTFQAFVRPVERPQLTPFCLTLTGIGQQDIDEADAFPSCATRLGAFARSHADQISSWGSWGAYDRKQLQRDSERHGIANPLAVLPHINLKREFARRRRIKEVGMAKALEIVGLKAEGCHHRGLDDAISIAKLLPWCCPGDWLTSPVNR